MTATSVSVAEMSDVSLCAEEKEESFALVQIAAVPKQPGSAQPGDGDVEVARRVVHASGGVVECGVANGESISLPHGVN